MGYTAALYCETIEGWFFASKAVNVTAKDNGGKTVSLTLTYKKAIDVVADNSVVLNICGKLAESMAVPYSRVTDAYGGYYGSKSASLPATSAAAKAATPAKAANAHGTKKRVLNTTNATTPAKTEWTLNLFIQPDPFAATVDNAATVTLATGANALKAIDGVTKTKYGAAAAKAAAVAEVAVAWVKKPAATGGAKLITIAGSVDKASYVYCAVSKTAKRVRMLNATKNTTAVPTKAAVSSAVVDLQSASTAAKYSIQRFEAKTGALAFSMKFDKLLEGKTYSWLCEATSLAPVNPAFRTSMEKGSAATSPAPVVEEKGDSALWSSLFAAVLMIAAVFFY